MSCTAYDPSGEPGPDDEFRPAPLSCPCCERDAARLDLLSASDQDVRCVDCGHAAAEHSKRDCQICGGFGYIEGETETHDCPACDGTGERKDA